MVTGLRRRGQTQGLRLALRTSLLSASALRLGRTQTPVSRLGCWAHRFPRTQGVCRQQIPKLCGFGASPSLPKSHTLPPTQGQLAKLLLSLSDPVKYAEYQQNPDAVFDRFNLTMATVLRSEAAGAGLIRAQADLTDDIIGLNAEHPVVTNATQGWKSKSTSWFENHQEAHHMIADNEYGAILVAEDGQLCRIMV